MALDAPVDVGVWMGRPLEGPREQAASFENVLDRFALHCATSPACAFGGDDPEGAIDALVERLDRQPLPLAGHPGVMVDGDLVLLFLADLMYAPSLWPATAAMLSQLEQGVTDLAGELFGVDLFDVDFDAFGRSWPPTAPTRTASSRTSTPSATRGASPTTSGSCAATSRPASGSGRSRVAVRSAARSARTA
jgi:hypothetical protein